MNSLEARTRDFICGMIAQHKATAVLSSFGKDSMVMLDLLREMKLMLPVIFHRDPWQPHKNEFADAIIRAWGLVVHDWPPSACGIKVNGKLETVARYQVGPYAYFDIPKNIEEPRTEKEPFACGLVDIMNRPKGSFQHPWDCYLIGHKDCDVDDFEGPVPLTTEYVASNGAAPAFAFPLKSWSDADVWRYLNAHRVPVQLHRYDRWTGKLHENHSYYSNDYITACTKCIDPREAEIVLCPKTGQELPNVSAGIYRFNTRPDYIERKETTCLTTQE